MIEHCGNCRFWKDRGLDGEGLCRRNPPRIIGQMVSTSLKETPDFEYATRFPAVFEDDWCGKWKSSPAGDSVLIREYRVDREACELVATATRIADAEIQISDDFDIDRRPLTLLDERLWREVPDWIAAIRSAAKGMTNRADVQALIDWAPLDNALAAAAGAPN